MLFAVVVVVPSSFGVRHSLFMMVVPP